MNVADVFTTHRSMCSVKGNAGQGAVNRTFGLTRNKQDKNAYFFIAIVSPGSTPIARPRCCFRWTQLAFPRHPNFLCVQLKGLRGAMNRCPGLATRSRHSELNFHHVYLGEEHIAALISTKGKIGTHYTKR